MDKDRYWRAISIDSISPEYFPDVSLYLRNGANYVLYKTPERMFTVDDYHRLERNFTNFLYARSGDIDILNEFVENSLADMLARDDLSSSAKSRILYQASVNCVIDMFESPEATANLLRCSNMVKRIMEYVATDTHGMTFINSEVFEKNDALSGIEYWKVKQHTQKGYEYLKASGNYSDIVLNIVRYHHERFDGNGYPTGIKGNDIPRSAQVAAMCNVYSSLIMDRPQRKAYSHADAIKVMREEAKNGAFNPVLFNQFVDIINERNAG